MSDANEVRPQERHRAAERPPAEQAAAKAKVGGGGFDATWLEGAWDLLHARRRLLVRTPLVVLLVTLAIGLLMRMGGAGGEDVTMLLAMTTLIVAFGAPVVVGAGVALQVAPQAGSVSRREELVVLPLGRWAFPAAIVPGSLGLTLASLAAAYVGITNGAGRGLELADAPLATKAFAFVVLNIATATTSTMALHGSAAAGVAVVPLLLPLVLAISIRGMGHGQDDGTLYVQAWSLGLAAFSLALPFIVQAWPVHVLSTTKASPHPDQVDHRLLTGGLLAALALAVGLHGLTAAIVVVSVVSAVRRARMLPRTTRRPPRGLRIAILSLLPLVVPLAAFGLTADLVRDARADRGEGLADAGRHEVAPGGRFVALERQAPGAQGGLSRVVVVDVTGERPPLVVPTTRFASLPAAGAWSSDGRWLLVHDDRVGRLRVPSVALEQLCFEVGGRRIPMLIEGAVRAMTGSVAVDAATGEVRRLGRVETAPGWRTPDELVEATVLLEGSVEITGPRSRFVLRRGDAHVSLAGYAGGAPVFAPAVEADPWLATVEPPATTPTSPPSPAQRAAAADGEVLTGWRTPRRLLRSEGSKVVEVKAAAAPWQVVAPAEELATKVDEPRRKRFHLARASALEGPRVVVDGLRLFARRSAEGSVLVRDVAGLERVDLPGGARTLLVPGVEQVHDAEDGLFLRTAAGWSLFDPVTGTARPLRLPASLTPLAFAPGGRLLAGPGHRPTTIVEADGRVRPLLP